MILKGEEKCKANGDNKEPRQKSGSFICGSSSRVLSCRDWSEGTKDRYFYPVLSTLRGILKR